MAKRCRVLERSLTWGTDSGAYFGAMPDLISPSLKERERIEKIHRMEKDVFFFTDFATP